MCLETDAKIEEWAYVNFYKAPSLFAESIFQMFLFIIILYIIKNYYKSGIEMVFKTFIKLYAIS